jgi:hypothetical protein
MRRALVSASESPENVSNADKLVALTRDIADAQARVEALYTRWGELSA